MTNLKNLWEVGRTSLNHTYVKHYFEALILRDEFKQKCLEADFSHQVIKTIVKNFQTIEIKTKQLMDWAVPFAIDNQEMAMLSQVRGVTLDIKIQQHFDKTIASYTQRYAPVINQCVKLVKNNLKELRTYIQQLEQADKLNQDFISNLHIATQHFSSSLNAMKNITPESKQSIPNVLVIDDHYASESTEASFYDKNYFLADYTSAQFNYQFCTGFDAQNSRYHLSAIVHFFEQAEILPNLVLLDVMFGDNEYFGLEILDYLTLNHPEIPVVMMTSKGKNELFERTIQSGAIDYLIKPFGKQELHHTVLRYITQNRVLGQEGRFLANIQKMVTSKNNLLIQTQDTLRAKSLFQYYASLNQLIYQEIDLEKNKNTVEKSDFSNKNTLYVLINIESLALKSQEQLLSKIKNNTGVYYASICSGYINQAVKQHQFNAELYHFLSATHINLENINNDLDMLMLFKHYYLQLSPIQNNGICQINLKLIQTIFKAKQNYTTAELITFLKALFNEHQVINAEIMKSFADEYFSQDKNCDFSELQNRLAQLKVEEFEILLMALSKSKQMTNKANKSYAVSRLLNKKKASTNEYNRWISRLWKNLPAEKQKMYLQSNQLQKLGVEI